MDFVCISEVIFKMENIDKLIQTVSAGKQITIAKAEKTEFRIISYRENKKI